MPREMPVAHGSTMSVPQMAASSDPTTGAASLARAVPIRSSPLLEREAELAAIAALVDGARAGAGRLIAFEGRAGMGKSRLVAATREAASAAGLDVLAARAGELEQEFAFGVVRQLFESLLATSSGEERAELLAGAASLAAPLFDESQLV